MRPSGAARGSGPAPVLAVQVFLCPRCLQRFTGPACSHCHARRVREIDDEATLIALGVL